jgi:hypothetical protein
MRLPKTLWKLLRSKSFQRSAAFAPCLLFAGLALFYWTANRQGQAELDATAAELKTLGIPTSRAEFLNQATKPELDLLVLTKDLVLNDDEIEVGRALENLGLGYHHPSELLDEDEHGAPTPLSSFFPADRQSETEATLAKEVLSGLQPISTMIQPLADALADPRYGFPPLLDDHTDVVSVVTETVRFLLFRSKLQAIAGRPDDAMADIQTVIDFTKRLQQSPGGLLESVVMLGQIATIGETAGALIEHQSLNESQLAQLSRGLKETDQTQVIFRSFELDFWRVFEALADTDGQIITLPLSDWRGRIEWDQDWDDWQDDFATWWWQLRPVGRFKSDVCAEIEFALEKLTRDAEGNARSSLTQIEIEAIENALEKRFPNKRHRGLMLRSVPTSIINSTMYMHTELRLTRTLLACERFRLAIGHPPQSVSDLTPSFLEAPLVCPLSNEALTITPQPDGTVQITATGSDPSDPIILTYDPRSDE